MRIRVTYDSNVVGSGTFFDDEYNGEELANLCATLLAKQTLEDGMPHSMGMWSSMQVTKLVPISSPLHAGREGER